MFLLLTIGGLVLTLFGVAALVNVVHAVCHDARFANYNVLDNDDRV